MRPMKPAKVTFEVWVDHPYKHIEREFPTFASAERSARALTRIHRAPVNITKVVQPERGKIERRHYATCRTDAYGRTWTDLMCLEACLMV